MRLRNSSTGLHIVRKRLKSGDRWYVYASRGGPLIHTQDGARPVPSAHLQAKAREARGESHGDGVERILAAYRASPEFASKGKRTQDEYRQRLTQISQRFGRVPARLIPEMKPEIILWRDELADTPRAADRCVGMLHTVLRWGKERGMYKGENPAADITKLHKPNRADLIWEDRHWEAVEGVPGYIKRVLTLGALTGLRLSDLLALAWEDVQETHIECATGKTGATAIIPLYDDLHRFLTGPGVGPILRTTRGNAWTADGWQSSWQRVKPEGFDRHMHDLRGTFATRLMVAGFSDVEIAVFMGWKPDRVAAIRARYVDRAKVARAMARRLSQ